MLGKILRYVDKIIGFILYVFLSLFASSRKQEKHAANNILVIKLWAIGETILTLPAIKALKKKYPHCTITACCTAYNKTIFEQCNDVDHVLVLNLRTIFRLKSKHADIAIDFEPYTYFSSIIAFLAGAPMRIGFSNRRLLYTHAIDPQPVHAVKNFINLVRVLGPAPYPTSLVPLIIPKTAERKAKEWIKENREKKNIIIGVHAGFGSSSSIRRWSDKNFAALCDRLVEHYHATIVFVGSEREKTVNKRIMSLMKYPARECYEQLPVTAAIIRQMGLFIGTDSGPMHLAACMGMPTIGLFGPNSPKFYGPYGKKNIGLYKGPEEPYVKPFAGIFPERMKQEYNPNDITVDDVMAAVGKILKHARTRPS
ncbi:MAG: glycosyltransferase family 9 protein [Candidatus Aenigmarchaeota archaeon]|nr:glycosyltransferase family 9 protein [Candidatus Aenigmarchaeota archaeon]